MYLIIYAILTSILLYYFLIKPHKYWEVKNVPHLKPIPIFGNFFDNVFQRIGMAELLDRFYKAFPNRRYCGIYKFFDKILFIRDTELIRTITIKDFDSFTDHQIIANEDIDALWSKNLFAMKGDKWRAMRNTLSPSFTGIKMKAMFNLINDCAKQFIDYLEEKEGNLILVETKDSFTRFTNDVIATCAFGITCNSLVNRDNDFYLTGLEVTDFSGINNFKFIGHSLSPTLMKLFKIKLFSDKTSTFYRGVIRDTIKLREEQNLVRPDMIQLLIEERKKRLNDPNNDKHEITNEDITAQALIFFIAGFEPSSSFMEFFAYEMAMNRDIQTKLRNEVMEAFEANNGEITYDAIKDLKYLEMCSSETLRKWPPTPAMDRLAIKDYIIPAQEPNEHDLLLRKGSIVWFSIYSMQRDPKYWPEPEKYDPERFNEENKPTIHPSTFIPFGMGPRLCIGNRFIILETKLIMCHILKNYEILPTADTPKSIKLHKAQFNLYPEKKMVMGFKRIK